MEDYLNKYDWVAPFNQGVAIVVKDNKYGAILTGGQEILAPSYEYISSFNNGFAQAIKNGQCVIVDLSGSECKQCGNKIIRVPKEYDVVRDFKDGLACVQKNGKWGVIDTDCKEIFPPKFFYISDFVSGTAKYKLYDNKQWGYLNSEGFCSECNIEKEPEIETDGTLIIERYEKPNEINTNKGRRTIKIDNNGNIIVKNGNNDVIVSKDYHLARDFFCGVACVQNKDGYWGVINERGEIILPFDYFSIENFKSERSFACDKKKRLRLVSSTGSVFETVDYSWSSYKCRPFEGDYSIIKKEVQSSYYRKDEKYGVIDKSGQEIIKISYDGIVINKDHVVVYINDIGKCSISLDGKNAIIDGQSVQLPDWCLYVQRINDELFSAYSNKGKWGIINAKGETICDPIYGKIGDVRDDIVVGESGLSSYNGTKYGMFILASNVLIPAIYDSIPEIEGNYYKVKKNGLYGFIDINGTELLKPEYKEITKDLDYGYYIIKKDHKQGLLNAHFETIFEPQYEEITIIRKGLYRICKVYSHPKKWTLFNDSGQISNIFDEMGSSVDNGLISVSKYGKSGFINEKGSLIIHSDDKKAIELPGKFSWGEDFTNGIAAVWINDVMNYVDEEFNIVINNNGRAIKILTDIDYVIFIDTNENYLFSYQGKNGLLSKNGKLLISPRFDSLTPFSDNLYLASINEKKESEHSCEYFGLMTTNNKEALPLIYRTIEPIAKIMEKDPEDAKSSNVPNVKTDPINYWVIKKGYDEKGLIDKAGNICLEAIYNSIEQCGNLFIVKRNTESHTSESFILDENFNVKLQLKGSISSTKKLGRLFWIRNYSESYNYESYILDENFNLKLQIRDSVYSIEPYDGKVHIFTDCNRDYDEDYDEDYSYGLNDTKVPDPIVPSKEQKYWLLKTYRYGLIDDNGNNCINAIYRNIVQFEHGFYVKQDVKWGILNENFEVVTEPKYDSIENYRDGYKKVIIKNNVYDDDEYFLDTVKTEGIINKFGQEIVEPIYHKIFACDEENVSIVVSNKEDCNLYGLMNKTYEFIVQPEFSYISTFHDGKAYARKRQDAPGWSGPVFQCGYLDTDGEFSDFFDLIDVQNGIYPDRIKVIGTTRDDLTIIQIIDSKPDNQYCAIINQEGEVIVPFVYHIIESYEENTYKAGIIDHSTYVWYLLNINFIELTHEACNSISLIQHSYVVTTRDGKVGLINHQGAALLPFDYSSIVDAGNNRLWIEEFHKKSLYDDDIYGYDHNTTGKYGLASLDGQILVEPKYHCVEPFIDGRAIVRCSYNEYGVIDVDGNEIIPLKYHYIKYDSEKKQFVVTKNFPNNSYKEQYKEGRFNIDGFHIIKGADGNDLIASKKYHWQEDYDENSHSVVYKDGEERIVNAQFQLLFKFHLNDENSVFVLPDEYDWGAIVSDDFLIVEKNNKKGVLKTDNTLVIDCLYDKIEYPRGYDGLFLCATLNANTPSHDSSYCDDLPDFDHQEYQWTLINKDGKTLFSDLSRSTFKLMGNSFIAIKRDNRKYLIYDCNGCLVTNEQFDEVGCYSNHSSSNYCRYSNFEQDGLYAIVGVNERFGAINRLGLVVIPIKYENLAIRENNQFVVDGYLMNILGQRIVSNNELTLPIFGEYDDAKICENGLIIVRKDNLYGCITQDNTIVIPIMYDELECYERFFVATSYHFGYYSSTEKKAVINYSNEVIIPFDQGYKEVDICDHFIKCRIYNDWVNKWGAYSFQGEMICDAIYDEIEYFANDLIKVGLYKERYGGTLYGLIDFKGNNILPLKYSWIGNDIENGRIPIRNYDGERKGFIDVLGNVLLEPIYSTIGSFIDGFAIVSKEYYDRQEHEEYSIYGVIDCSCNVVIPCVFKEIQYEKELGLFKTEKGYKTPDGRSIIDLEGTKVIVNEKYAYCSDFNNGCAIATSFVNGKRHGLINTKSEDILPPIFQSLQYMDFGLLAYKLNGKWGVVNCNGNIVLPNIYDSICKFDGNLAMIKINNNVTNKGEIDSTLYGYINSEGRTVLPAEFSFIGKRNEEISVIRKGEDSTWGLFNRETQEFKMINNAAYIGPCKNGLCLINIGGIYDKTKKKAVGGKWGYISADGNVALSPVDYLGPRSDNYSVFEKNEIWGLFNLTTYEVTMIKKVSYLGSYKDGLCLINIHGQFDKNTKKTVGGKWGYINIDSECILPAEYDFIGKRSENYSVIRKDRSWGLFNLVTHEVKEIEEASCLGPCIDGLCRINVGGTYNLEAKKVSGGKWGYLAPDKGIVMEPNFSMAISFQEGLAAVKIDDKWGFINTNGDMIVPCEYDELISSYTDGKGKLCRNDYIEVFDKDGKNISSRRRRYYGDDNGYDDYNDDYVGFDDYDTPTYDKYGGPGGYSDQTIDEAFDGDPSLLSNID